MFKNGRRGRDGCKCKNSTTEAVATNEDEEDDDDENRDQNDGNKKYFMCFCVNEMYRHKRI